MRALASPASLKGVLSAPRAAAALVAGFGTGGMAAEALPIADGGEGTAEVLAAALGGKWQSAVVSDPLGRPVEARWLVLPDGTAVVESAEALGLSLLSQGELDPLRASSRGLGELILAVAAARPTAMLVGLGGTATMDGGAGLREILTALPVLTLAACDVASPLLGERGAARAFGPQKGATPDVVEQLEARLASMEDLRAFATAQGAGAGGGLGAALAALGAQLVPGARLVLDLLGFRERVRGAAVVVTGEGTVDATTTEGKAPGEALAICREENVRCALFGGRVEEPPSDTEIHRLSGRPERAEEDLEELGERLARSLLGAA